MVILVVEQQVLFKTFSIDLSNRGEVAPGPAGSSRSIKRLVQAGAVLVVAETAVGLLLQPWRVDSFGMEGGVQSGFSMAKC